MTFANYCKGFPAIRQSVKVPHGWVRIAQQQDRLRGLALHLFGNHILTVNEDGLCCLVLSGIGAIFGLVAALALTRLMKSLLFEVSPADPVTYVAASAALILAAILGSYLPARRATRIDPAETLRAE